MAAAPKGRVFDTVAKKGCLPRSTELKRGRYLSLANSEYQNFEDSDMLIVFLSIVVVAVVIEKVVFAPYLDYLASRPPKQKAVIYGNQIIRY